MLLPPKTTDAPFACACDYCRAVVELTSTTEGGALAELRTRGWMDEARRGVGARRWKWKCTTCRPQTMPGHGLSTGHMMPPKKE